MEVRGIFDAKRYYAYICVLVFAQYPILLNLCSVKAEAHTYSLLRRRLRFPGHVLNRLEVERIAHIVRAAQRSFFVPTCAAHGAGRCMGKGSARGTENRIWGPSLRRGIIWRQCGITLRRESGR